MLIGEVDGVVLTASNSIAFMVLVQCLIYGVINDEGWLLCSFVPDRLCAGKQSYTE